MPDQPPYRSPVLEHLGLVAGRYDALSIGDVRDHATPRPEMRDRTGGAAVQALGLKGLGGINHALSLGPRCLQNKPTSRRLHLGVLPPSSTLTPAVGPWTPSLPLG